MTLENRIALTRETVAFLKLESAWGVLAPPSASDAVSPTAVPSAKQAEAFTPSAEITGSRSLLARFRDKTPAGEWSLSLYPRPAGSAGSRPAEAALLKAALGDEAVNVGVNVVYAPALDLPSLSLCFREGHTTHFVSGCVVESLAFSLEAKGALRLEAKGKFKEVLRAGSEETASDSTTTLIKLAAGGARLFDVGASVRIGPDDRAGAGYLVGAKDEAADTITLAVACGAAPSAGVLVQGFLPAPTLTGAPVESHTGLLTMDSAELLITSGTITIANQIKMIEDEVSGEAGPTGFTAGQRTVSGELKCFFRRTYAGLFGRARSQAPAALRLSAGDAAGRKLRLDLPSAVVDTPEAGGDEYQRDLTVAITGLATVAGENEISVTYE